MARQALARDAAAREEDRAAREDHAADHKSRQSRRSADFRKHAPRRADDAERGENIGSLAEQGCGHGV